MIPLLAVAYMVDASVAGYVAAAALVVGAWRESGKQHKRENQR